MKTLAVLALAGAMAVPFAADVVGGGNGATWEHILDKLAGPAGAAVFGIYVTRRLMNMIETKDKDLRELIRAAMTHPPDAPKP